MHCDYLNKFIWGVVKTQDSKREEKIDENSGSNPRGPNVVWLLFFAMQHWLN
jgi:hypothetical protein